MYIPHSAKYLMAHSIIYSVQYYPLYQAPTWKAGNIRAMDKVGKSRMQNQMYMWLKHCLANGSWGATKINNREMPLLLSLEEHKRPCYQIQKGKTFDRT